MMVNKRIIQIKAKNGLKKHLPVSRLGSLRERPETGDREKKAGNGQTVDLNRQTLEVLKRRAQ
jgi:hypothetical protein